MHFANREKQGFLESYRLSKRRFRKLMYKYTSALD